MKVCTKQAFFFFALLTNLMLFCVYCIYMIHRRTRCTSITISRTFVFTSLQLNLIILLWWNAQVQTSCTFNTRTGSINHYMCCNGEVKVTSMCVGVCFYSMRHE